jgi:hypothetical protein
LSVVVNIAPEATARPDIVAFRGHAEEGGDPDAGEDNEEERQVNHDVDDNNELKLRVGRTVGRAPPGEKRAHERLPIVRCRYATIQGDRSSDTIGANAYIHALDLQGLSEAIGRGLAGRRLSRLPR